MRASATPAWISTSGGPSPSAHHASCAPSTSAVPAGIAGQRIRRPAIAGAALLVALLLAAPVAAACDVKKVARADSTPGRAVRAPLILGDSTMLLAVPRLGARGIEAD